MYKKDQILLCIKTYYKNSDIILEYNNEYIVENSYFSKNQRRFIKNLDINLRTVNVNNNGYRYTIHLLLPIEKLKEHLLTKQQIREYKIRKLNDSI